MFPTLQLEILDRFTDIESHFKNGAKKGVPGKIARGLAFVEIYAVWEYAVRHISQAAIDSIAAHGHNLEDLRPGLLSIFLNAELNSLRDCGDDKLWDKRLQLFERGHSKSPIVSVAIIPHDGSHYRHTQLQTLFRTLGIKQQVTRLIRHRYVIDEIVNNRNDIAHGHKTPAEVGQRYSRQDVWRRIDLTRRVCLRLIRITSKHCSDPASHLK